MYYIKQLTFLRFLAAILVVIFHYGQKTWPFNLNGISTFISNGSIAVSFFFFLSGVVLALNYLEKENFNKKKFYIKRFARIYPTYILAFIITYIAGMLYNNAYPTGISVLLQILTVHAWFPEKSMAINYPSWSISVEVFFYALFPFIVAVIKKLNYKKVSYLIVLIWLLSVLQHYMLINIFYKPSESTILQFILYFPLWHLNTFLMGFLCAIYILRQKEMVIKNYLRPRIFWVLGSLLFVILLGTENSLKNYTHNGLLAPIFFLIIAGLSVDESVITRFLGNSFFVLLGNSSYAIYILQLPILILIQTYLSKETLNNHSFYVYIISLTLISLVTYIFYENKMRALITSRWIYKNVKKNSSS